MEITEEIINKEHIVYVHINKTNGKCYVGQTCQKPEVRWNHGRGYKENIYFYRAIEKYGFDDGFEHCILKENLSQDEADYWERYYIDFYKSTDNNFGYNLDSGGNKNKIISDETKRKMSENHYDISGENNPMFGKKHKSSSIKKMSDIKKGKYDGENNPNYNNHKLKGLNNPNAKPVYQYDLEGNFIKKWEYAKLAAETLGIDYSNICECCRGSKRRKTTGGYIWEYE